MGFPRAENLMGKEMRDTKNLAGEGVSIDFSVKRGVWVVALLALLPIWLLGFSVVISVMKFLRQPALYGYVPVWVLVVVVILFILYVNRNRD